MYMNHTCLSLHCAGVARRLPGLSQQFVQLFFKLKDAILPSQGGGLPAAQLFELFIDLHLRLLALGDVAQHEATDGRPVSILRGGVQQEVALHERPECRSVLFHHPQLADVRLSRFKELFAIQG